MFNITDLQQKMELKIIYLEHIMGKRSQIFVHAPLIISNDIDLAIYDLNTGLDGIDITLIILNFMEIFSEIYLVSF